MIRPNIIRTSINCSVSVVKAGDFTLDSAFAVIRRDPNGSRSSTHIRALRLANRQQEATALFRQQRAAIEASRAWQ